MQSDVLLLVFEGELDLSRQVEFENKLRTAYDHPKVIIDLSRVTYVDSSFLSTLVVMRSKRRANGFAPAHLVGANEMLQRVLGIAGLDELWPMCDTLDEAMRKLQQ